MKRFDLARPYAGRAFWLNVYAGQLPETGKDER